MPRDGSNIYHYPPGIEGVTDQVIESADYNSFISDVEQDLNLPRPIIAGGTGANNSSDAMDSLGGEVSKIQVTNYDSHPFKAGSFYSGTSATNAPVVGHAFAGVCYTAVVGTVSTTDMFIEARDMDDASSPPTVYVRQKKNNVWSGWMVPAVGGTNPNFSGIIKLNGRTILAAPIPGSSNILTDANGNANVETVNTLNNFRADTHSFYNHAGGSLNVQFTNTEATFNKLINAGFITCTPPSLDDNTSRVPTTSWVNGAVANIITATPDFPQTITTVPAYTVLFSDIGKHIFHPAGTGTVTIGLSNNFASAAPIGATVMFVNLGGIMTITPDNNTVLRLAGATSTGNRTLSGTTVSMATILKVINTPTTTEWIIWGTGLT